MALFYMCCDGEGTQASLDLAGTTGEVKQITRKSTREALVKIAADRKKDPEWEPFLQVGGWFVLAFIEEGKRGNRGLITKLGRMIYRKEWYHHA